nr:hypothetical protein [Tanacetum cinerariifolium]
MMKKSSSLENEPCCSNNYKKNTDILNNKINDLKSELSDANTYRPSPTIESTSAEGQNKHSTTAENGESTDSILSKPVVKFVKAGDRPAERPTTDKVETVKKPAVRYAEMYIRTSKRRIKFQAQQKKKMMKKSSSSENEPCCSKDCKKNTDSLNSKINDLKSESSDANTYRYNYKLGVDQLEGRLTKYKEREEKYIVKIRTIEMYRASDLDSIKILTNELETLKEEKDVVDGKLTRLLKSSKDLKDIIKSQRSDKVKERVGYNAVPPPAADLYRSPKKDLSWTGLPEFVDDTVTDYSRPPPTIESTSAEGDRPAERPMTNKAKFVIAAERPTTDKVETIKKPTVRYAEMYRRTSK